MPAPTIRPAGDPLDDMDRDRGGADTIMARRERADLPGERLARSRRAEGDTDEDDASGEPAVPGPEALEAERTADGDPDIETVRASVAPADTGRGPDDDDTIDETERAGDDSIR